MVLSRNLHINPGAASSAGFSTYTGGSGNALDATTVAADWSASGFARRATWTSVVVASGDLSPIVRHALDEVPVNTPLTLVVSWRVSHAGPVAPPILYSGTGGVVQLARSRGADRDAQPGVTYTDWVTFRSNNGPRAYDGNTRIVIGPKPSVVGFYVEMSQADVYLGELDPSRMWHWGEHAGWVWEGTPNASFSTGPEQYAPEARLLVDGTRLDWLDVLTELHTASDSRALVHPTIDGTPPSTFTVRPAGPRMVTLRAVFGRTTALGTPGQRSIKLEDSLRRGVLHRVELLDGELAGQSLVVLPTGSITRAIVTETAGRARPAVWTVDAEVTVVGS